LAGSGISLLKQLQQDDRRAWRYVGTNPLQGKFTCVESQSARLESGRYLLPIERCAG
jgi:hypothetical protein